MRRGSVLTVVAVVVGLSLVGGALTSAYLRSLEPSHTSVWRPPPEPSPVLPAAVPEQDVVIPASAPLRLEIPSIGFDSAALVPEGQSNPIQEWTQAMDDAYSGIVTPPDPWSSSLVYDSTVAGGGLFGTDAQTNGRILAHTTPWGWDELGAFNTLIDVREGDPVAITTSEGRVCYTVTVVDKEVPKGELNVKYSKTEVTPLLAYLITCSRDLELEDWRATKENLVLTLQLDQQATNTGGCSW